MLLLLMSLLLLLLLQTGGYDPASRGPNPVSDCGDPTSRNGNGVFIY